MHITAYEFSRYKTGVALKSLIFNVNIYNDIADIKVLWPNMTFYARGQKFHLQDQSAAEVL